MTPETPISAPATDANEPLPPAPLPDATEETVAGARPWIPLLFLLSGATGLAYEVLWSKYLGFVLGNAAHANALVLATFLGGLSLGAALLGRFADRVPNQLYLYAWLELGIALMAGMTPSGLATLEAAAGGTGTLGRVLIAAGVLLPPTLLMGGTLPALSRFLTREVGNVQGQVARLYFLNSAGAVAGAILTGFWLIPRFGMDASLYIAAFTNVLIGIMAMHLSKQGLALPAAEGDAPVATALPEVEVGPLEGISPRVRTYALIAVLVSGFVALCYEVAWIRLLALVLGSSTYSFTLMIAAFVGGIAIGSFLVERGLAPGKTALGRFALAELGVALGVLLTLPAYERLPYWFLTFKGMLGASAAAFPLFEVGKFAFCFALMLVPTVFLGMTLPLATRLVIASRHEVGKAVGAIFGANTLGNVLGATAATLWLLPWLGIKGLIDVGVLINLLVAAAAAWLIADWPLIRKGVVTALPLVIFAIQRVVAPGFDMQILSSGVFRDKGLDVPPTWQAFRAKFADRRVLYNKDDANTTVTVAQQDENIYLSLNGKVDASSAGDLGTQILSGQLPMLLRPNAKDMLVIGFGSGITAGSALTHPLTRLDCAEISPAVMEAGRYFAPFNHDVQKDGRFKAFEEDGLTLLRRATAPYDVIVTEPSNSWMAGVGNLFTVDAYYLMARKLKPEGLVVQWLPLYETDDETLQLILRSFVTVFPYTTLWQTEAMDTVIVGSQTPWQPDFQAFETRAKEPGVAAELRRAGVQNPASALMLQLLTPDATSRLASDGPLNSLRFPRLEYQAPVAFYADATAMGPYRMDTRLRAGGGADPEHLLDRYLAWRKRPLQADEFATYAAYQAEHLPLNGFKGVDAQILRAWREAYPADTRAPLAEAQRLAGKGYVEGALALALPAAAKRPGDAEAQRFVAKLQFTRVMAGYGFLSKQPAALPAAIAAWEQQRKAKGADLADVWSRLAALRHVAGDRPGEYAAVDQAVQALSRSTRADADSRRQRLYNSAASTALADRDGARARGYLEQAWAIDPTDPETRRLVARFEAGKALKSGN